jgi:hypothetical protein
MVAPRSVRRAVLGIAVILAAILAPACGRSDSGAELSALGEAYAGPMKLEIRQEIDPESAKVATVSHGTRLDIVQVRRRFVRVRTPEGKVGWIDGRHLLTDGQMRALAQLSEYAAKLPSQGKATVFDPLNVHTEPNRPSTSFFQITPGVQVEVVGHRLVARENAAPQSAFRLKRPERPAPVRRRRREPKIPPPPKPAEPGLPEKWQELSKTNLPPEPEPPADAKRQPEKPPLRLEDWYLVRTPSGKAGWVLARNVMMSIPDDVAQYSEGARITSYFALKEVRDYELNETKRHWLWTTIRDSDQEYQFDSFRVFTWVLRRHRYETAYIERGIEGYYPVEVKPGEMPEFWLILREKDGRLMRKHYIMEGYMVRKVDEELYVPPKLPEFEMTEEEASENETSEERSIMDRLRNLFQRAS